MAYTARHWHTSLLYEEQIDRVASYPRRHSKEYRRALLAVAGRLRS